MINVELLHFLYQIEAKVLTHYHIEVQANPKKMAQKIMMLFSASMGETRLCHDIFLEFSLRSFDVVEVK